MFIDHSASHCTVMGENDDEIWKHEKRQSLMLEIVNRHYALGYSGNSTTQVSPQGSLKAWASTE